MLVDSDRRIKHINSSYLATLLLKWQWHGRICEKTFHVNSSSNNTKYLNFMVWKSSLQKITTMAIIWEISDSNLETGRYRPKSAVSRITWRVGSSVLLRAGSCGRGTLSLSHGPTLIELGPKSCGPLFCLKLCLKWLILWSTDFDFANYGFLFRKLEISHSTDIFHFIWFCFILQITVSLLAYV